MIKISGNNRLSCRSHGARSRIQPLVLFLALSGHFSLRAQAPPWAIAEVTITGASLTVEPSQQTVPLNVGTVVNTHFGAGGRPPADWRVKAELSGPAFTAAQNIEAAPGEPLQIPPLPVAGSYLLKNIRLTAGALTLSLANPSQVEIDASNVVVSQVSSRPMTADEIQQSGIAINENDYKAVRYTVGMVINSKVVDLDFPVLFDRTDLSAPPIVLSRLHLPGPPPLQNVLPKTNPNAAEDLDGLDLDLAPFSMQHDDEGGVGQTLSGLLIFPNRITFLNQFFVVGIVLQNGAPGGSPLQLADLTSTIRFPNGSGFVLKQTTPSQVDGKLPLRNPGADGKLGTADDLPIITAGMQAQGEFDVETPTAGTYQVTIDFRGTLNGLPTGKPAAISGHAGGTIVVRDPTFHVTFAHPAVIRKNQPYSLKVTLTNTSTVAANDVTLSLPASQLIGAALLTGETESRALGNLGPGQNATVSYKLVALRTGQVTATSAAGTGGTGGTIVLTAGVGDSGIPLSPDTLILPPVASEQLPEDVVNAGLDFLGLGWSLATAPPNSRPANLAPVSEGMVRRQANQLTKLARFVKIADGNGYLPRQALSELALLWSGAGTSDAAFDALRRLSPDDFGPAKGQLFANVLGAHLASPGENVLAAHRIFAQATRVLNPHFSVAIDPAGPAIAPKFYLTNAQGRVLGDGGAAGILRDVPWSESYPLGGGRLLTVGKLADTDAFEVRVEGQADGVISLSVLAPLASGVQWASFEGVEVHSGSRARVSFTAGQTELTLHNDIAGNGVEVVLPPTRTEMIALPPLTPLGAIQDLMADQVGRAVSIFYNRPVLKAPTETIANYAMNTRSLLGAFRQDDERVVEVRAVSRLSPLADNRITVGGQQALDDGSAMVPASVTLPVHPYLDYPGGVLSGVVYGEGGIPLPGAKVWLYENESNLLRKYDRPVSEIETFKITQETFTDANGAFGFDYVIQSGMNFKIVARDPASSREAVVKAIIGHSGEHLDIALFMRPRGRVEGHVYNPDGTAAVGALVTATEGTSLEYSQAVTDAFGGYRIDKTPIGTLQLKVETTASGHAEGTGRLNNAGDVLTADFHLVTLPVAGVRGVIKSANGSPLAGAAVAVLYSGSSISLTSGFTDANGAFLLTSIPPGSYGFQVYEPLTFRSRFYQAINLVGGATLDLQNIFLPVEQSGFGTVSGHLFGGDHTTIIANAQIYVTNGQGGIVARTVTDVSGGYLLGHIPLGSWQVTAYVAATRKAVSGSINISFDGQAVGLPLYFPALGNIQGTIYKIITGGTRVAAAGVTVYLADRTARTNFEGKYQFVDVPLGRIGLTAAKNLDDIGFTTVDLPAPGVTAQAPDITLLGHGEVTVHVYIRGVNGQPDQPVMGAVTLGEQIITLNPGPAPTLDLNERTGASDATAGAVTFGAILGTHVFASACNGFNGCGGSSIRVRAGFGGEVNNIVVYLEPTGGVQGTVFAPDGVSHIPYARVTLSSESLPPRTLAADATGHFEFDLVPLERVKIVAVDNVTGRFGPAQGVVTRPGPEQLGLNVTLLGEGALQGVVLADDGTGKLAPVSDAQVTLTGSSERPERRAVTDAAGQFFLQKMIEGDYAVAAIDLHRVFPLSGRAAIHVDKNANTTVEIVLASTGVIRGALLAQDRLTPVANAQITLGIGAADQGFALTDSAGRYLFAGVPLNLDLQISAYDARSGRTASGTARLLRPNQEIEVPLSLNVIGNIAGKVTANNGSDGISFARVTTYVPGSGELTVNADSFGNYVMPGLPAGSYIVYAVNTANGASVQGAVTVDDQHGDGTTVTLDLRMLPFGGVEGIVTDAKGFMVDGAIVTLDGGRGVHTNAQGLYHFDGVSLADHEVIAADPFSPDAGRVVVRVGSEFPPAAAPIRFVGLGTVTGAVVDATGRPVEGYSVAIEDHNSVGPTYTPAASTPANGTFTFVRQRAGHIKLVASSPSGSGDLRRGAAEGELTAGNVPLNLMIQITPSASVRGIVVAGAQPVYQAIVSLTSLAPAGAWSVATASDGSFRFPIIPLDPACLCNSFTLQAVETTQGRVRAAGSFNHAGEIIELGSLLMDGASPAVASTVPADQTINISPDTIFHAQFSEPVDPATVNGATIQLLPETGGLPLPASIALAADGLTVSLTPNNALPGQAGYQFVIRGGVQDLSGNPIGVDTRAQVRSLDNVPPFAASVFPADQATEIDVAAVPFVTFSEPVTLETATVTLASSAGAVSGVINLVDANSKLIFLPSGALAANQIYTLGVSGAKDSAGNPMLPFISRFATSDTVPPAVTLSASAESDAAGPLSFSVHGADSLNLAKLSYGVSGAFSAAASKEFPFGTTATDWTAALAVPANIPDGATVTIVATARDASGKEVSTAPTTMTLYRIPQVRITAPGNGTSLVRGTTTIFSAQVQPFAGTVQSVTFLIDGAPVATVNALPYEIPVVLPVNARLPVLTAVATAGSGKIGVSTPVTVILIAPGIVTGYVYQADDRTAAANATVRLDRIGAGYYNSALTDGTGKFTIIDVQNGDYQLSTTEPNTGLSTTAIVTINDNTVSQKLLFTGYGTVNVHVRKDAGTPIAGALLTVKDRRSPASGKAAGATDAGGNLAIPFVPSGDFSVTAVHPQNRAILASANGNMPSPSGTLNVSLTLTATATVQGQVRFASGSPAPGVTVLFQGAAINTPNVVADSSGKYEFGGIPLNTVVAVKAFHPFDNALGSGVITLNSGDGSQPVIASALELPIAAKLNLYCVDANNSPLVNAAVYRQDGRSGSLQSIGVVANDGHFLVPSVTGGNYLIEVQQNNFEAGRYQSQLTLQEDGQVINIRIPPLSGTISVTVTAADGVTPVPGAKLILDNTATGAVTNASGAVSIPLHQYRDNFTVNIQTPDGLTLTSGRIGAFTAQGQVAPFNFTLPWSVITGQVRYNDSLPVAPVAFPSIVATGVDGVNHYQTGDQSGHYLILGVPAGSFTLTVNDSNGLTQTKAGQIDANQIPVVADVVMPPAGSINGHLNGALILPCDGNCIYVQLAGVSLPFTRNVEVNSLGNYALDRVPFGDFTVHACAPVDAGGVPGPTVCDDQPVTVFQEAPPALRDLTFVLPSTGVLQGTIYDSGNFPVSFAGVSVDNLDTLETAYATADQNGHYLFSDFRSGRVRVSANDPKGAVLIGEKAGDLPSGAAGLTLDVTLHNISPFVVNLDGADGFRYDVDCYGQLQDGGAANRSLNDAYDAAYSLSYTLLQGYSSYGDFFDCTTPAPVELGGRQVVLRRSSYLGANITRKVYVPASGGFARYIESIENPGAAPISMKVQVNGNLGSDLLTRLVVDPAVTGESFAITDQQGICCDPLLGHVYGGVIAPAPATINPLYGPFFTAGMDNFYYHWLITVPAYSTRSVMHFAIQRDPADLPGVQAQINALRDLSDPNALDGMSAGDKAAVVNFAIP